MAQCAAMSWPVMHIIFASLYPPSPFLVEYYS
jgi:hypothetical protein